MGFSRQEYWSGRPCPPPGDLPNPGMESSILAGGFFTTSASWEAPCSSYRLARLILSHFLWDLTFNASASCPRTTNSKLTGLDEILPLLVLADWTGPLYSRWFSSWEQVICTGLPNISEHKYNLGLLPVHWTSQAKGQWWSPETNSWKHADTGLVQLHWSVLGFC